MTENCANKIPDYVTYTHLECRSQRHASPSLSKAHGIWEIDDLKRTDHCTITAFSLAVNSYALTAGQTLVYTTH